MIQGTIHHHLLIFLILPLYNLYQIFIARIHKVPETFLKRDVTIHMYNFISDYGWNERKTILTLFIVYFVIF